MKRTVLPAAVVLAAVAAVPATASAATIGTAAPCQTHIPTYSYATKADPFPTTVNITGGTPGARFLVAVSVPSRGFDGSAGSESGTFDAAGNGSVAISGVSFPSGGSSGAFSIGPSAGRDLNLSVQDYGQGGAVIATGTTKITNFAADITTKGKSLRSRLPIQASGSVFAGQKLYAFVTRGTKGKTIKRYSLGTANACGYVSARERFARGRSVGSYSVIVQPGTKLDRSKPFVASGFRVFRRSF